MINRVKMLLGSTLLTNLMLAGPAHAEGQFSGTVALTSDYVFRGVTQTSNNPAIQGSLDYSNGPFYAGVWGSNVDFGADETIETDVYAGFRPSLGPVTFDFGVIGYFYPGSTDTLGEYDYVEGKAAASFAPVDSLTLAVALYYSPEFFGETGDALYGEITGAYALSDAISVSGGYGSQDIDAGVDYETWNLGASLTASGFKLDVRYHDTDISGADDIVNVTISRSL
ncbi:MAG: TorF family putative porin [Caulobacteraceae bacterium]